MSFQRTSELAGGGQLYAPAMMEHNGSSTYTTASLTTSGNQVTLVARFKIADFAGTVGQHLIRLQSSSGNSIGLLYVAPSGSATPNQALKLGFFVQDTASGTVCRLLSKMDVVDTGQVHTVFASADASAGTAIFYVDGKDADDLSNPDREAPTTGTLGAGAGSKCAVASSNISTNYVVGDLGYVGIDTQYLTNWDDFMTADGQPKELDEVGWTEWGSQPLYWNSHGEMSNNQGSVGNMSITGTIVVGDSGSAPPHRGIATIGDITASDLPLGKVGWANAQRIVGSNDPGNTLALLDFSKWTVGSYSLTENDFILLAPGASLLAENTWSVLASGYANSVPGAIINLPAHPGNGRRFISTLELMQTGFADGLYDVEINYVDGNNHVICRVIRSGSSWMIQVYTVRSGTTTNRGSYTFSSSINDCWGVFVVSDYGDMIDLSMTLFEKGATSTTVVDSQNFAWYDASRTEKSIPNVRIGMEQTMGAVNLRQFTVMDI